MERFYEIVCSIYPVRKEIVADMWQYVSQCSLSKGDMLIKEGDIDRNLYFIREGLLRSYKLEGDKDDTLWFATRDDAVTSMHSFYRGEPAIANIEALADTELFKISRENLDKMYFCYHELANWGRMLAEEELYCLERKYKYIGTGDAYSRFCAFMEMRSKEVIQLIPLKYIASYLGIAPQTLSKLRARYGRCE